MPVYHRMQPVVWSLDILLNNLDFLGSWQIWYFLAGALGVFLLVKFLGLPAIAGMLALRLSAKQRYEGPVAASDNGAADAADSINSGLSPGQPPTAENTKMADAETSLSTSAPVDPPRSKGRKTSFSERLMGHGYNLDRLGADVFEDVAVLTMIICFPLVMLVNSVPVTIGGLGVREGASVLFFSQFAVQESSALGAALLLFAINILIPGLCGLTFIHHIGKPAVPLPKEPS
jgi:hypothetical protein